MMRQSWRVILSVLLAGAACSSTSSKEAACDAFTACGGDVVGTWKVAATCVTTDDRATVGSCAGATVSFTLDTQGTVAFAADSTYRNNVTVSTNVHIGFPASCLPAGATCASVETSLKATYATAHCTGDATSGCTCDAQGTQPDTGTGHYTVAGSSLTLTEDGEAAAGDPAQFCVLGSQLTVRQSTPTVTATYVANKQ